MTVVYLFEDLYVWMMEEIYHLQKKGVKVIPVCIRPRKASNLSKDFLGEDLMLIAEETTFLHESLINPKVIANHLYFWLVLPHKMCALFCFLVFRTLGMGAPREFKFRDWKVFFFFSQLAFFLKSKGLKTVHCHFASYAATYVFYFSKISEVEYYLTVHAADIFLKNNFRKEKLFTANKIFSISKYNKEFLIDCYGEAIRDKIIVNHTGTDINFFSPSNKPRKDVFVIMSLALLVEHKGLRYLFEACKILKSRGLEFILHMYGTGPEVNRLKEIVKNNKLDNVVVFMGRIAREDIPEAFNLSSVFVLPSVIASSNGLREGIPQVFKECMACGLPAISTYTGGIPEVIDDGVNGYLVHERDSETLANRIEYLIRHTDERERMSQNARTKIVNDFNIDKHTNKIIEVITQYSKFLK